MKTLTFTTTIKAPVQKVWDTMLQDATYREWTKVFNEHGSFFEGKMEKGAEIRFLGPDADGKLGGMMSRVKELDPQRFISFEHYGQIQNGVEDTTSDQVKAWAGSYENYTFSQQPDGNTLLQVDLNMTDDFVDYMEKTWPAALEALKEIAER
jgi:uncharacterized protein YndB with AHSA1/START domain